MVTSSFINSHTNHISTYKNNTKTKANNVKNWRHTKHTKFFNSQPIIHYPMQYKFLYSTTKNSTGYYVFLKQNKSHKNPRKINRKAQKIPA